MSDDSKKPAGKTIDLAIEIAADRSAVWRAISDGEEMSRWFAPRARIEPGEGGSVWISWGGAAESTATIDVWREGERLRTRAPGPGEQAPPQFVEYRIEGRGGSTLLRLVHSGFGAGDEWEEFIDTLDSGWRYFLFNLKHYLERHAGSPRRMVSQRREVARPKPATWERLVGRGGPFATELPAVEGAPVTLWSGDAGTLVQVTPAMHLAARVPSLNEALLLLELEPGGERYHVGVWLSLYGAAEATADRLERSLGLALEEALADRS